MAGVQLLGLELGPSSLEVGHLFLDHPALLLHALLLLRHALLHLVEARVQLKRKNEPFEGLHPEQVWQDCCQLCVGGR